MSPRRSIRTRRRFLVWAILATAVIVASALGSPAAADERHVHVLRDRGGIFEPANPFDLEGRVLKFTPSGDGYRLEEAPLAPTWEPRGDVVPVSGTAPSARVSLRREVTFFGRQYGEIFVHRSGAIGFGGPLGGDGPAATRGGELVGSLLSPVPFVAGLWSELGAGDAGGGRILVAEREADLVVTWDRVSVARPAGALDSFRIVLSRDGSIAVEYRSVGGRWGVVGLSAGLASERTRIVELVPGLTVGARETVLERFHDLPRLNQVALTRQLFGELRDVFPFVTVFTSQDVDAESTVASTTVRNDVRGIGLSLFDEGALWGSRRMEHLVLMGAVDTWADDPLAPPRAAAYAYAPSTVAVLAHETGHRWLAHLDGALGESMRGADGHWSFFLDSGGSLLGGSRLQDLGAGTFATGRTLGGFGSLDQYLMGVREPDQVEPFFVVEGPNGFSPPTGPSGHVWSSQSRPQSGVAFRGQRRDLTVQDVIAAAGPREPAAGIASSVQRMAFVLVAPAESDVDPAQVDKVDRIRRAFGAYFAEATGGRARMQTWLPRAQPESVVESKAAPLSDAPRVLTASLRSSDGQQGRSAVTVDFLDLDGDVVAVEASSDATDSLPPAIRDVVAHAFGHRRGSLTLHLSNLPEDARELRLTLVDRAGHRSEPAEIPLDSERLSEGERS